MKRAREPPVRPCRGQALEVARHAEDGSLSVDPRVIGETTAADDALHELLEACEALWLRRRVLVLRDGVDEGEFEPIKIPEEDNAADVYTKYLVFQKWKRHTDFINNMNKQREDKAIARMALVTAAYSSE
jgi:hypothetical protein